jgi:hypothetical protein
MNKNGNSDRQAAETPSSNGNVTPVPEPILPEPPETLVMAAVADVPAALLSFWEQAGHHEPLTYQIAFADEILRAFEDAGSGRVSPDLEALCALLKERFGGAPGAVPIVVPARHGFIPWPVNDPRTNAVLVRDLVRRLRAFGGHVDAACVWAVHGRVEQGLLGAAEPWRVRVAQVGGLYPNLHPNWEPPRLEPVASGAGGAVLFTDLAVWAKPALWGWWRLSPQPVATADGATSTAAQRQGGLADKVAYAVGLRVRNPDWSDARIAEEVGVSRTTLYAWEEFKSVKAAFKATREELPRGHKGKDGTVEAYDDYE